MNDISRTLPSRVFTVNGLTVRPRARQMGCKGDLSVNLCQRYVFGGWYHCSPVQYYERHVLISNPVYISSSIIYALPLAHACRVNIVGYINPWEVPSVNNPNTIFPWILLFPSGLKVNPTLQYLYYTCTIIWWAWLCKLVSPHPGVCSALLAMLPVTYINIYMWEIKF